MNNLLSLNSLELLFQLYKRDLNVLNKVDLKIFKGEKIAVVGESGSGKSVMLRIILGLLNYRALKKFKNRLDPRKYNGAIFLGLNGPVVKSHGSTDALGFSHSIKMCTRIVKGDLIKKIKNNLNK